MDQGDSRELVPQPQTYHGELLTSYPQDPDELRRDIEDTRRQIAHSFTEIRSELTHRVEDALDWRQWVHDHPHTAVGIAFGIGLYLGIR